MKTIRYLIVTGIFFLATLGYTTAHADDFTDTIHMFKNSPAVRPFFKNCYGYAVFPTVGKGGIGIGGAYGVGQVYAKGIVTGTARLIKASIGFQAGGQAFSQMIFFEDKRAYTDFIGDNFEMDAGVSVVAVTAGAQAKAGTEGATASANVGPATGTQAKTSYYKGMIVFVYAKGGMMFEATVGGQTFIFEPK